VNGGWNAGLTFCMMRSNISGGKESNLSSTFVLLDLVDAFDALPVVALVFNTFLAFMLRSEIIAVAFRFVLVAGDSGDGC
jgi:hypothetical protein